MSDPTRRPLQFPAWHLPYIEKHKIFALFHEIAKELVMQQPDDHVLFTKQILLNAAQSRNVSRIVIITTPKVNTVEIAKGISELTGHIVISEKDIIRCSERAMDEVPAEILVNCLKHLVRAENCYSKGWIMVNCIRDENDAKLLIQRGIIPTHVIHPIAPFHPDLKELLYCNVKYHWPVSRRNISGIRNVFKAHLKEVHLGQRKLPEVVVEIINVSKIRKTVRCATPRVVIIGPRGSGRKTQAKLLESSLQLVHIDFEYLLCQIWISPSELGAQLRACRQEVCFHSELLVQVINKRLLDNDCLTNGWVLTGFPFTDTDFKYLDTLDTPPNRVVFLECDLNICRERLVNRRINVETGSTTNIKDNPDALAQKTLVAHPKDALQVVNAELEFYCQNYGPMRKYCGETACVVNGDMNERWVHEMITSIILRNPLGAEARKGLDLGSETSESSSSSSVASSCGCLRSIPTRVVNCFVRNV